jgi:antitoxin PrlF
MAAHRVTSKGQVTIPKADRDALGIRPGDVVEFERDGERLFISRAKHERADDHPSIKRLAGLREHMTISFDDWRDLIRRDDEELP